MNFNLMPHYVTQDVEISGREVEQLIQVIHTSSTNDLQNWLQRGVFLANPRFHYSKRFDTATRLVARENNLKSPLNMIIILIIYRVLCDAPTQECIKIQSPVFPAFTKLKSLDLFAGCGGLTLGLEAAGLAECVWAVEMDKSAAKAFKLNFPKSRMFNVNAEVWFENLKVT